MFLVGCPYLLIRRNAVLVESPLQLPAIPHAVHGVDMIEVWVKLHKLFTHTFDMRSNGGVVYHHSGFIHELLAAFNMTWALNERMQHPKLCYRQQNGLVLSAYRHSRHVYF